ncbi:MAG TPA: hypothetical protein VEN79_01905, partial [Terriglobia bacterium]|nr:hypothetical protein [Terriglobia bacterium]
MKRLSILLAIATATACSLSASTIISGTFDLDGTIIVTANCSAASGPTCTTTTPNVDTISWESDAAVNSEATIEQNADLTGSFLSASLGNTLVSIQTLVSNVQTVGGGSYSDNFISFLAPSASTFPTLLITAISAASELVDSCSATTPVAGQTCVPPGPGGSASPFLFTNTAGIGGTVDSTAQFTVGGVTSDGQS